MIVCYNNSDGVHNYYVSSNDEEVDDIDTDIIFGDYKVKL